MKYGWDLAQEKWRELKSLLQDKEWKRAYLEADYDKQVARDHGVYLICASPRNVPIRGLAMEQLYNAIYVGQAKNLRARFRDHVRGYRDVQHAKAIFRRLDFWYTAVPLDDLDRTEQALISALGPAGNARNVKARVQEPRPAGRRDR